MSKKNAEPSKETALIREYVKEALAGLGQFADYDDVATFIESKHPNSGLPPERIGIQLSRIQRRNKQKGTSDESKPKPSRSSKSPSAKGADKLDKLNAVYDLAVAVGGYDEMKRLIGLLESL